jgi:hypothetical protein
MLPHQNTEKKNGGKALFYFFNPPNGVNFPLPNHTTLTLPGLSHRNTLPASRKITF